MNNRAFRCFGIVPAAGSAQRMGEQKLLLPYQGRTLIEHILAQWNVSSVDRTLVVVSRDDNRMIEICRSADVICVVPDQVPVEMKYSVQAALEHIQQHFQPAAADAWLLAPADLPRLSSRIIDRVIAAYDPRDLTIVVPRHGGRRGHPAMFPWSRAEDVHKLQNHQGVNSLLQRYNVREIQMNPADFLEDVDNPADYRRATNRNQ